MTTIRKFLLLLVSVAGITLAGCGDGPFKIPGTTTSDERDGDDHADSTRRATEIRLPSTTPGTIEVPHDTDNFRFQLRSSTTLVVHADDVDDEIGSGILLNCQLLGPNDLEDNDCSSGRSRYLTRTVVPGASPGSYYVIVSSAFPELDRTGDYELRVWEDDHGDTEQTATTIRLPSITEGEVDFRLDYDYFRFQLQSAAKLVVTTTGSTNTEGWLTGPNISEGRDTGGSHFNFGIVVPRASPGTYYVSVDGHDESTGEYELHVRAEEPEEPGGGSDSYGDYDGAVILCSYNFETRVWSLEGWLTANRDLLDVRIHGCVRPLTDTSDVCDTTNRHFLGETDLGDMSTGRRISWKISGRPAFPDELSFGTSRCWGTVTYDFPSNRTNASYRHSLKETKATMIGKPRN